jgi:hypothetical protein
MQFKTANKINGFKPVSYGMAVKSKAETGVPEGGRPAE